MTEIEDRWADLGGFIREQRRVGQLSLRKLSEMAGISNPYLSQIERGMRKPSAEILRQIAGALHISAETLYIRAGILDERDGEHDLVADIRRDPFLDEAQKKNLVHIYLSFRAAFLADLEARGLPIPGTPTPGSDLLDDPPVEPGPLDGGEAERSDRGDPTGGADGANGSANGDGSGRAEGAGGPAAPGSGPGGPSGTEGADPAGGSGSPTDGAETAPETGTQTATAPEPADRDADGTAASA